MTTTDTTIASPMRAVAAEFDRFDWRANAGFDGPVGRIMAQCLGWSGVPHYLFFRAVLAALPHANRWLVLGVYQGRDIAMIGHAARRMRPGRVVQITGVDRFSGDACADWPEEARNKSWQEAGFGPPPHKEIAWSNLYALGYAAGVTLHQSDDAAWLEQCQEQFDVIYIDTAHDYETVKRQIRDCRRLLAPGGLMCGDDYQERPNWGVVQAVTEAFPDLRGVIQGAAIWFVD